MSLRSACILTLLAGVCVTISDAYFFLEPTKHKGCVDIVGAQGGCCNPSTHGSCVVFRNVHDYCYCEGSCFHDDFCCSDIQETGCIATQTEEIVPDENMLASFDKKLRGLRSEAAKERKRRDKRSEQFFKQGRAKRSKRALPSFSRVKKQVSKGNPARVNENDNDRKPSNLQQAVPKHQTQKRDGPAQKKEMSTVNKESWYLSKTRPMLDIASDIKHSEANGESTRTHTRGRSVAYKKRYVSGEEEKPLAPRAHRDSTKRTNHSLLGKLQQLLQGIASILKPKRSEAITRGSASPRTWANTESATQKWTTPIYVGDSKESNDKQPRGPFLHRPIAKLANMHKQSLISKADTETKHKVKNAIQDRMVSGQEGVVKTQSSSKDGIMNSAINARYGRKRTNPWLARHKTVAEVEEAKMREQALMQKVHAFHGNSNGDAKYHRLVKRGEEEANE